ncbi:MAG TPA: prepilin-type N-terminal cleavage/methylation domain-containing protein [Candidatus Lustribacter sp.]|nr:prepilin-type N-terminal cleavage/methylation domain-containing protein [Candidatus Lustribacter sp.]
MRREDGFTLLEVLVVTAIVVIVAGTLGTFFLAGASPAVASAGRDVTAAFDEARRTALAFDAATVVFTPSGSGYRARVYERVPGDPAFRARNGPDYESGVAISEIASPLGAPAFAFAVASSGAITGFAAFVAGASTYVARACPASGTFTLQLAYERDVRIVTIPCMLGPSSTAPASFETPVAAYSPTPFPVETCPAGVNCGLVAITPAAPPSPPAPSPTPTAPPSASPTAAPSVEPTGAPTAAAPGQMIEQYSAAADGFSAHTSTLFANGSICDDNGCSLFGAIDWTWACPFGARGGSNGNDGSNDPYQPDNAYWSSVSSMIAVADHNAAEGDGDGLVSTQDSYCAGYTTPDR